jgi:CPA1 family monovalent cation:H+ antiporter
MDNKKYLVILILSILTITLSSCGVLGVSVRSDETLNLNEQSLPDAEIDLILIEEIVIGLLLIAALVGIVTKRFRLPYTVGLILMGLVVALRGQEKINVNPDIFLALLVPPLIFEAAFHLNARSLRRDLAPILALAIPGVLITTFLVGGVIAWGAGFPFSLALVFGSLVAATDPVAVVALFRSLGVPKRLQVLLEGESLFNDGTAIVVFNLMVIIAVSGEFSALESILDFFVVSSGGLAIGFGLGVLI